MTKPTQLILPGCLHAVISHARARAHFGRNRALYCVIAKHYLVCTEGIIITMPKSHAQHSSVCLPACVPALPVHPTPKPTSHALEARTIFTVGKGIKMQGAVS
jgi:hypothetical protein